MAAAAFMVGASGCGSGSPAPKAKPKPKPPEFVSAASATFTVGKSGGYDISVAGSPSSVTEKGSMPPGLTFSGNSHGDPNISGMAAQGTGGRYSMTLTATNQGGRSTQQFVLVVDQAPQFTKNVSVYGVAEKFDNTPIKTTGYPPAKLTLSGVLPSGLTFQAFPDGTALISGRPGLFSSDNGPVSVFATNVAGSISETVNIHIVSLGGGSGGGCDSCGGGEEGGGE